MSRYRRPESVLVLVYVPCGEVLVLKRRAPFNFWQSVTGSLDPDETPAVAAQRELAEETGIADATVEDTGRREVFTIDRRWRHRYAPGVTTNTEHEFRVALPETVPISLDQEEHAHYDWCDVDTAIGRVWSWTNRAALERLRDEW